MLLRATTFLELLKSERSGGLMRIKSDNVVCSQLERVTFEVTTVTCGGVIVILKCKLKVVYLFSRLVEGWDTNFDIP